MDRDCCDVHDAACCSNVLPPPPLPNCITAGDGQLTTVPPQPGCSPPPPAPPLTTGDPAAKGSSRYRSDSAWQPCEGQAETSNSPDESRFQRRIVRRNYSRPLTVGGQAVESAVHCAQGVEGTACCSEGEGSVGQEV